MRVVVVVVACAVVVAGVAAWAAGVLPIASSDPAEPTPRPTVTTISASAPATVTPPVEPPTGTVRTTLRRGAAALTVQQEDRQPYLRRYFGKGWIDADRDCRDTRQEVLARESQVPVGSACAIRRGKWLSYYDDKTWLRSFEVQIDHVVPLAEAWDSGAYQWTGATRIRYANDLADARALVPTTTALNYAKVADDPARYVPAVNVCRYITSWIAVKLRWNMTVDARENKAIDRVVASCPDARLTVKRARIDLLAFAAGTGTRDADVRIESIVYRGTRERVVLRNRGSAPSRLVGWVLHDEIGFGQYRLPVSVIPAGGTLTVHSSAGTDRLDASGNPVRFAGWGDVWNNTGDVATLIDGRRLVTDTCRYRGDDTGKARC